MKFAAFQRILTFYFSPFVLVLRSFGCDSLCSCFSAHFLWSAFIRWSSFSRILEKWNKIPLYRLRSFILYKQSAHAHCTGCEKSKIWIFPFPLFRFPFDISLHFDDVVVSFNSFCQLFLFSLVFATLILSSFSQVPNVACSNKLYDTAADTIDNEIMIAVMAYIVFAFVCLWSCHFSSSRRELMHVEVMRKFLLSIW